MTISKVIGKSLWPALLLCTQPALALRPFDSTDADVLANDKVEIEIGLLGIEHQGEDINYVVPHVVFNYGIGHDTEIGAEFSGEKPQHEHAQFSDPALFVKTILREGALQEKSGFSVALETSALLPARSGETTGGEAVLLISNKLGDFAYHFNVGGGENRDRQSFVGWGVIGELPLSDEMALVSEYATERVASTAWQRSLLVGLTFAPHGSDIKWDAGVRSKLNGPTSDASITMGLTVGF